MPEDPAEHMKDYINLHYFFEQKRKVTIGDEDKASSLLT